MTMRKLKNQLIAGAVSLAMVLTAGVVPGQTASAASQKVKLSATKVTVKAGKSKTVKVKTLPKGAKFKKAAWTSQKKTIAKVSKKTGKSIKITGVKKGSTTVTCKVTYKLKKKNKSATLKIKVTVQAASQPTATTQPPASTPSSGPAATGTTAPNTTQAPVPDTTDLPAATTQPPATPVPTINVTPFVEQDDTTNIGEEREVTIVGGISDKMVVKDNGIMRKDKSTQDLIATEMGQGINLGNTMEATKALGEIENFTEATDFEQAWSAPITTQEYIDAVHSYGFNTLRIPVAWSSMVSNDGEYTINPKMLGRVEEIANYALNNGMYVIINIHWDYGWWGQFGSADKTVSDAAWKRFESYWEQIAERFKDYSDHVILESANEELGHCLFDKLDEKGFRADPHEHDEDVMTEEKCYELTNAINQKFLDIVRASGGNNANRHLLIAGDNTNIDRTVDAKFIMPEDTAENGKTKLSVSVHYYDPWQYCGDGMTGSSYEADYRQHHIEQFDKLKRFTDEGYGVIVGEFGVCNPRQDRVVNWLLDVMEIAAERGCLPVLWDTPGMYFDRTECKMVYKDVAELYNAVTGANGDTSIKDTTGVPKNEIGLVDITDNDTPVWSWVGQWKKNDAKNIGLDGNVVTATDVSKFVQMESCTDDSKITFNDWGYQTYLHLDWAAIQKPCIKVTFAVDTMDAVGTLELATTKKVNGSTPDQQKYSYSRWAGKGVVLSEETVESLLTKGYLYLTFGNGPTITGIYVYDLGE